MGEFGGRYPKGPHRGRAPLHRLGDLSVVVPAAPERRRNSLNLRQLDERQSGQSLDTGGQKLTPIDRHLDNPPNKVTAALLS